MIKNQITWLIEKDEEKLKPFWYQGKVINGIYEGFQFDILVKENPRKISFLNIKMKEKFPDRFFEKGETGFEEEFLEFNIKPTDNNLIKLLSLEGLNGFALEKDFDNLFSVYIENIEFEINSKDNLLKAFEETKRIIKNIKKNKFEFKINCKHCNGIEEKSGLFEILKKSNVEVDSLETILKKKEFFCPTCLDGKIIIKAGGMK